MITENNLAAMLSDFANLQRTADAIRRLRQKWPEFLPKAPTAGIKVEFHSPDLGEVVPYDVPEDLQWIIWLKMIVSSLWTGNPHPLVVRDLEKILLSGQIGPDPPSGPTRFFLGSSADPAPPLPGIIGIDWKHRTFVYRAQTTLQRALAYLMQNSHKAKTCANPDCPAPFFISARTNSRYCSEDCVEAMRREAKRSWWGQKGIEWRKKRQAVKSKRKSNRRKA